MKQPYSLFFIAFIFCLLCDHAKLFAKPEPENVIDSVFILYGENKVFTPDFFEPALMAIRKYPELTATNIEFRYKKIGTVMAARPKIDFVLRKKENRKYLILISNKKTPDFFENMSLCSKTGIMGHEFAHILVYEQKSNIGLVFHGISYLFNSKRIERQTDMIVIERGLGQELLSYNLYINNTDFLSVKYMKRKERKYLSIAEINELIDDYM